MLKKFLPVLMIVLLGGCAETPDRLCPLVTLSRENSRLIQKVNYQDDFEVEFKGYEGYCFYDKRVNREKARITPIFVVTKLRKTDESDVHFSWFTETLKGPPEYLGRRDYFTGTTLPQGGRSKEFRGQSVELKIPDYMKYEFEINAGLNLSKEEKKYNRRIFDVDFEYYEGSPQPEKPAVKLNVYPQEVYEDGTPVDVKYYQPAPQEQNGCFGCD